MSRSAGQQIDRIIWIIRCKEGRKGERTRKKSRPVDGYTFLSHNETKPGNEYRDENFHSCQLFDNH